MQRSLRVFMNGRPVATVAEPRTNKFTLTYEADAADDVSVRLPRSPDRYPPAAVAPWVDSIVPSAAARQDLAERLDVPEHLLFRFLAACGADLPGGIVIGDAPDEAGDPQPLAAGDLIDDVAVVAIGDSWARPATGMPSSHVLRPEDDLLPGSAAAEAFALTLARNSGIAAVEAELGELAGVPVLIVPRPDRIVTDNGTIRRRHLEAFGSLCGVALDGDDERIYEERGGPGFSEIAEAVDRWSVDPQREVRALVDHMVLHFCVGNTNAHANTYSLLQPECTLGPITTLLPAEIYHELVTDEGTFDIDHKLAMSIGGRFDSDEVTFGALVAEAATWPRLGRPAAEAAVEAAVDRISRAVPIAVEAVPSAPERLERLVADRLERLRAGR